jgi:hypothetical protein
LGGGRPEPDQHARLVADSPRTVARGHVERIVWPNLELLAVIRDHRHPSGDDVGDLLDSTRLS